MNKIKIILSKDQVLALQGIIKLSCDPEFDFELDHLAAKEVLTKLFLKIMIRLPNLKVKKNKMSLTIVECWAIKCRFLDIYHSLGPYETTMIDGIFGEINRVYSTKLIQG